MYDDDKMLSRFSQVGQRGCNLMITGHKRWAWVVCRDMLFPTKSTTVLRFQNKEGGVGWGDNKSIAGERLENGYQGQRRVIRRGTGHTPRVRRRNEPAFSPHTQIVRTGFPLYPRSVSHEAPQFIGAVKGGTGGCNHERQIDGW